MALERARMAWRRRCGSIPNLCGEDRSRGPMTGAVLEVLQKHEVDVGATGRVHENRHPRCWSQPKENRMMNIHPSPLP